MFPLWDVAMAPVIEAVGARRIVEIGALRGENTVQVLDLMGPDGELHVIDPVPAFDPEEHARQFDGRYVFHQALSVDVLGDLPPMDVALIDGDHNWYTVYHECKMLADVARDAERSMPVMVLHDVLWPYGRRDLYYDPSNIPEEHRQPYDRRGIQIGREKLLPRWGLNSNHHNALVEGGPRNGVMAGLEDFIEEYDRPVRLLVLPVYFGLALVAEEEQLERSPELRAVFDRLESAEGRADLMDVAEQMRLKAMVHQHSTIAQRDAQLERATTRYLEVTKAALLNEHYLDHELRFNYLMNLPGDQVDPVILRDPVHNNGPTHRRLVEHRSGVAGPSASAQRTFFPYTAMGRPRIDHLQACLDDVRSGGVPGDFVDCGTSRGGAGVFMRAYLDGHELTEQQVWVFDEFRASPDDVKRPEMPKNGIAGFQADINLVRDAYERFGLLDERVTFVQGVPHLTAADAEIEEISLLRVGHNIGGHAARVLTQLYDKVAVGGHVMIELGGKGSLDTVEKFRSDRGISSPLGRVDEGCVTWQKTEAARAVEAGTVDDSTDDAAPVLSSSIPRPTQTGTIDLTVVVVFYNMKREAARTLRSLSRAYQEGIDGVTYEVLAIENGSSSEQRLGREFVESFGPEFRYIDMGDAALPSPVRALNRGVAEGAGRAYALMIDGAHVVTPGVVRFGLLGLDAHAPAIVCTQQWYIGPGQQGEAMDDGYDEEYEDRLFNLVQWPQLGYRLFEIGSFIGDRDWFDGMWESNCLFVTRAQLAQVGAFDEAFSMPGGGYANLELYERLGASPEVSLVTMIGEASFHQSHGGTTTNQPDPAERRSRVFGYGEHYAELRGRPFSGPGRPIYYVGRINNNEARRSKARRASAKRFTEAAKAGSDAFPESPVPVPDELSTEFLEAVWQNMPWTQTTWMGDAITTPPNDLFTYQQLVAGQRPDWILVSGGSSPGPARFLADMCELAGHGTVVSVAPDHTDIDHPRLRHVEGTLGDRDVAAGLRELVGDGSVSAVLASRLERDATVAEFVSIEPLVSVGGFVVVTDTVVNGNPVWTGFGPGPAEAVKVILRRFGGFVQDSTIENYSLSFNHNGYLRRVGK